MLTNSNRKITQEAIQIANAGNPMCIIDFFKEWHDSIEDEIRLDMICRMLNGAAKTNMLINGCFDCLGACEVGFIILHILQNFDEDTFYMVKMPLHIYLHIMGIIVRSHLASNFIKKMDDLDLIGRFQYKFRNYMAADEPINHELREIVTQYITVYGTNSALKKLLNTLPMKPSAKNNEFVSWANS